ncbi:uncharacterized protein BO97DRAFT_446483 [Aspergillus homomorphus CBS 101889]|uniref:Uncharacterized protein n=1 Tax=Aspergillus homomorphus (strain CBS 101889) TaxID=1450537 RepID=A0A395HKG5_ASPHC|nr:hypothetical protein BO97DRAFT_446483 [Aspergillus homomorphus CBS 101889]RAL07999.1 hypothetical protein BO97DRAFT_446483 [Aspergillus homomorphus CBS 101889]
MIVYPGDSEPRMASKNCSTAGMPAATTARFISEEGVKVHQGLGGWSEFDDQRAQFDSPKPYINLEGILKDHVQSVLGINPAECSWDAIFDKVTETEKEWKEGNGARAIFAKVWLKVGENREMIDPWINLIPDSYGLAVVKSGIAVVLNLAAKSAETRQRILTTFQEIQTVIVDVKGKRQSFHTDPNVSKSAKDLYFAVVDAIESLLCSLPSRHFLGRERISKGTGGFRITSNSKIRRHEEPPEQALQRVKESVRLFQVAVARCRDAHIETIERYSRDTYREVGVMRWDQKQTEINTRGISADVQVVKNGIESVSIDIREVKAGVEDGGKRHLEIIQLIQREEERLTHFIETQSQMMGNSQDARNQMLQFLLEDWRKERSLNLQLQQRLFVAETEGCSRRDRSSPAVISFARLLEVLVQSPSSQSCQSFPNENQSLDYGAAFGQPNDDLEIVLGKKAMFGVQVQSQAQSILQDARFLQWMNQEHPDLLLVDANLRAFALDNVSPISLFCATFVLSMAEVRPEEVVTHFFCGLHCTASLKDYWAGPNGLLRSLICQLLMILHRRDLLSMDFLNSRSFVKQLEEHELYSLCILLHQLVRQFPSETTVYCILDAVCCFDKDLYRSFQVLTTVIEYLHTIVQDDSLRARFKVLMTNADQSTRRLRQQVDVKQHITLSSQYLSALQVISDQSVAAGISRPSTPSVVDVGEWKDDDEEEYEW